MVKLCNICNKNERYGRRKYCRECINKLNMKRYHTDEKYRLKHIKTSNKSIRKRYNEDENFRKKIAKKNRIYYICGYYNSPGMNINHIKFWMKRLSNKNLNLILDFIDDRIKELD